MADNFNVVAQEMVTEFVAPNLTRDLHQVTARAEPSGIIFSYRFKPVDYTPKAIPLILHDVAKGLNTLAAEPGVVAVTMENDVTSTNMMSVVWLVTVESSSGDSTTDVRLSWAEMFGVDGYPKIARAVANMDAIEAL